MRMLVDLLRMNASMGFQTIGPPPSPPVFAIFNRAFAGQSTEPTREQLEQALMEALANEEYEVAAELRDHINGMKE